jgi:hypothetical protein
LHDPESSEHRQALDQALAAGKEDRELAPVAAELLRLFPALG